MKAFKFPTGGRRSPKIEPVWVVPADRPVEETIEPVQGIVPGSVEEWRVAWALDKLGLEFRYQVPVAGGRRLRGGQVVDFVIDRPPESIPLQVFGRYWHRSEAEERLMLQALKDIFKTAPVILWDDELETKEAALAAVRRELSL